MIVRPAGDGTLLLVTQPDHARLAAALISAWTADTGVPAASRPAVLFAIEQHDNGWREIDAAPALNAATGRPYDFTDTPPEVKQDIWPRGVGRLAADSPLAAALVAHHALALYAHRRQDPAWQAFFSRLEQLHTGLLQECAAATGPARETFERSYDLLRLGDLLSLVFCNRWTDPMEARGYRITLGPADEQALLVSPDPFGGACIHFEVAARVIPDRRYRSDDDLRAAVRDGNVMTLNGTARGVSRG
jgi:hypothetical protein